tara:strand:+ start:4410 stop:4853 length:444 start_codon:yes stop_codon:yes gene_type:complete
MADEEKKYGVKEPNEGTDGMVASNMTGEAIKPTFDYGDITERDKDVVMEIIKLLRERENIPYDMIIEEMKIKFQLEEIPMQDISHSVWGQMTKDERIGQSIQGFRMATDENGKKIKIPHVGFSADLDYLNEFIQRLVKKIGQIKEQK